VRPMTRAFAKPRYLNIFKPACVITRDRLEGKGEGY
jgi:hypothetical protein